MSTLREKLKAMSKPSDGKWQKKAKFRKENKHWLTPSFVIALKVLDGLDDKAQWGRTPGNKEELSYITGISLDVINEIVKGRVNLTLGQIARLENALGISLLVGVDRTYTEEGLADRIEFLNLQNMNETDNCIKAYRQGIEDAVEHLKNINND